MTDDTIDPKSHTDPYDPRDDVRALDQLHRAGWSIGDAAFHGGAGGLTWIVWGYNGENLIRAEGSTRDEAWGNSVEQARGLGMLGGSGATRD